MPDLELQIRSYFDATTRAVDVDELLDGQLPVSVVGLSDRPTRRGGILVVAAVVVVVVISLAVALVLPGSDAPPVAPTTTTTVPLQTATTVPTSTTVSTSTTTPSDELAGLFDPADWIAVYENPPNNGRSIDSGIRLIHPDGDALRDRVVLNGLPDGVGMMPDWSPDGTKLAMARRGVGLRSTIGPDRLYEKDLASGSTRALFECADPCVFDWYPAYSPDGTEMAFVRQIGDYVRTENVDGSASTVLERATCGIWVGSLGSLDAEQVTSDSECITTSPRWSPSGEKLVYASRESPGNSQSAIFVIDLTSLEVSRLTQFDLGGADPDWSPDGQWIVFGTHPTRWWDPTDTAGGTLYRVRPDGTDLQEVPSQDEAVRNASRPRYTPDGEWIVFSSVNEVWVVPSEGGRAIRLLTGGRYAQADWQP